MAQGQPLKEKALRIFKKLKSDKKRFVGVLLIVLGVILGAVSRVAGGSPFQDFTAGILMGLSAGILIVGLLMTLLTCLKNKEKIPK